MRVLSTPAVYVGHVILTIMGTQGKLCAMVDRWYDNGATEEFPTWYRVTFVPCLLKNNSTWRQCWSQNSRLGLTCQRKYAGWKSWKLALIQAVSASDQQAVATTSEPAPPPQPTYNDEDQDLFGFVKHNAGTENVTRVHSIDQETDA